MSQVQRRLQRASKTQMWAGTVDDLRGLVDNVLEPLADQSRERLRTEMQADGASERSMDEALAKLRIKASATLKSYGEELSGPVEDILSDIADRAQDVRAINFFLGNQSGVFGVPEHGGFRVIMSKYGVNVYSFGPDRNWVDIVTNRISEALEPGRPWYAFFRNPIWGTILVIGPTSALFIALVGWMGLKWTIDWGTLLLIYVTFSSALTVTVIVLFPRWIPFFELMRPGSRGRGAFAVSAIGTGILFVASSIIFPIILR